MLTIPVDRASFHLILRSPDLKRAARFYSAYLGCAPHIHTVDLVEFQQVDPPIHLQLQRSDIPTGNSINHVGLRLLHSEALVEVQHRLEAAGYATRREDSVECCYAKQTKFWVHDPDGVLWETYTLHEDIDHHGVDTTSLMEPSPPTATTIPAEPNLYVHTLGQLFPERLPYADGELDAIRLEGLWNEPYANLLLATWVKEAIRTVKPGGEVLLRGMVADAPFPGVPDFPGLAAKVKYVPVNKEPIQCMLKQGLRGIQLDRLQAVDCLPSPVKLFSMVVRGTVPLPASGQWVEARYHGLFEVAIDDDGNRFPRGEYIQIPLETAQRLQQSEIGKQFSYRSLAATTN